MLDQPQTHHKIPLNFLWKEVITVSGLSISRVGLMNLKRGNSNPLTLAIESESREVIGDMARDTLGIEGLTKLETIGGQVAVSYTHLTLPTKRIV